MAFPKWQLRVGVELRGKAAVMRQLQRHGKAAKDEYARALHREAQAIMRKSQKIVPVDTGELKRSAFVRQPRRVYKQDLPYEIVMGYGNVDVRYAMAVHERLDVYHKPPTQAKYLERPMKEAAVGMSERIAAAIRRKLG